MERGETELRKVITDARRRGEMYMMSRWDQPNSFLERSTETFVSI